LSIDLGPRALQTIERVGAEARRAADLASVEPGQFVVFGPGNAVVYAERIRKDGMIENVFLQRRVGEGKLEIVVARLGEQVESDDPDIRFLVLHEGRRYEGIPGTLEFRVVEFLEHGIPYRLPSLDPSDPRPRAMSFQSLLQSNELEHIAEMQWRIGVPLAAVILSILAVPLSRTRPRTGRYGRIAIGLLVFIIYLNMLSASKAWIEQGVLSPSLGLWWVHAGMLLFALFILARQNLVRFGIRS
jgi:lipopolysaccharide export system permease protein